MKREIFLIKIFFIFIDFILFYLALVLTLAIRFGGDFYLRFQEHFYPFFFLFPFHLVLLFAFDLYNFYFLNFKNLILKIFNFFLTAFIFSIIYFYFSEIIFQISPKTNLLIFILVFTFLLIVSRLVFIKKYQKDKIKTYFLGRKILREKLIKDLKDHPLFSFSDNKEIISKNSVLIIDPEFKFQDQELFKQILNSQINVFDFVDFYEKFLGRIPLEVLNFDLVIKNLYLIENRIYFYLKRFVDLMLAIFFFIFIFVPLLPLISILIYLNSPGSIFFLQERVGYRRKIFKLIKFRTMEEGDHRGKWAIGDEKKRIFFIGKILRKTHLDELPQLINILKGDISFVGPRPEQPEISKELEKKIPFYDLRYLVIPGLTGWAQVNYKYPEDIEETKIKLEYDLFYLKNNNLFLDVLIIIKTFQKFLGF